MKVVEADLLRSRTILDFTEIFLFHMVGLNKNIFFVHVYIKKLIAFSPLKLKAKKIHFFVFSKILDQKRNTEFFNFS